MTTTLIANIGTREVAEICKVSEITVRRWMRSGLLKAEWVGGRLKTTVEWIQEMSRPVETTADIREQTSATEKKPKRSQADDDHNACLRDLAIKFGVGTKVSRQRMRSPR